MKEFDKLLELRASQAVEPPKSDLLEMPKQRAAYYLKSHKTKTKRLNILYGMKLLFENLRMAYYDSAVQIQQKNEIKIKELKRDIAQREWAIMKYKQELDIYYRLTVFYWQMEHLYRESSDKWFELWKELVEKNRQLKQENQQLKNQLKSLQND